MATVDILMPYYGDVPLMRAAVRSVLAQDDPRWRLTVVDDGRADGVPEWFAGIDDERVRYLRNDRNLGVTGNFNRCLSLVEHEFVVLMGCDDLLLPHYVRTVLAVHDDVPGAAVVQPGVVVIDGAGKPVRTLADEAKRRLYAPKHSGRHSGRLTMSGEPLAVSLLRGDWLYFPSLCWRASTIAGLRFRDDLGVIQDLAFLLELVQRDARLVVDDAVCFEYRRHTGSESSSTAVHGSRFVEAGRFFAETAVRMTEHGWPTAARVARRHLSSRLFALTLLPNALRQPGRPAVGALARHAFGRPKPTTAAR
ncbi:MAG TPA: glycosyltransferase family 2 protein [Pseudonocardiaceae bacterium]|jgi:glycosyltransferase involved in cell wall biosynthesis|nr:glycosyltransferase family 2 protein [Pseudonocardiaceae bacterium]